MDNLWNIYNAAIYNNEPTLAETYVQLISDATTSSVKLAFDIWHSYSLTSLE